MAKQWIAATCVRDEWVSYHGIEEIQKGETSDEAIRRILAPEVDRIGGALVDYTPTGEEIQHEYSKWNIFIFNNERDVERLLKISPPDYVDDLEFAIAEMFHAIYEAFGHKIISAIAEGFY